MTTQTPLPAIAAETLAAARQQTDSLFRLLVPEAWYDRPIPERHRLIFYLGHLEAFDWNLLARYGCNLPAFHPEFDRLFAFGIDPEPGRGPQDQPQDWPTVDEVCNYVGRVREEVDDLLADARPELLHTAVEHRLMHAETLAYLFHQLELARKTPAPPAAAIGRRGGPAQEFVEIPSGTVTLGQTDGFGWDNEFASHRVSVRSFAVQRCKVSNGDYLAFVHAGGSPSAFWRKSGQEWKLRTMFTEEALPLDHPVFVTLEQAKEFAAWRGKRLITEPEWHRAACGTPDGGERQYPWGEQPPSKEHGNFNFQHWDTVPVNAYPAGNSAFDVAQLAGNGWEWTNTVFAPFKGFAARPYYPGYSADFFDGQHYVLKGGSPRTAAVMLRRSFRNWFRPEYPYVYATFRLAGDLA